MSYYDHHKPLNPYPPVSAPQQPSFPTLTTEPLAPRNYLSDSDFLGTEPDLTSSHDKSTHMYPLRTNTNTFTPPFTTNNPNQSSQTRTAMNRQDSLRSHSQHPSGQCFPNQHPRQYQQSLPPASQSNNNNNSSQPPFLQSAALTISSILSQLDQIKSQMEQLSLLTQFEHEDNRLTHSQFMGLNDIYTSTSSSLQEASSQFDMLQDCLNNIQLEQQQRERKGEAVDDKIEHTGNPFDSTNTITASTTAITTAQPNRPTNFFDDKTDTSLYTQHTPHQPPPHPYDAAPQEDYRHTEMNDFEVRHIPL